MSDELRAAAQEIADDLMYLTDKSGGVRVRVPESWQRLACAYLAEHPQDDDEPVTEDWLRSVGFNNEHASKNHWRQCLMTVPIVVNRKYLSVSIAVDGHVAVTCESFYFLEGKLTRADVRRLCKALGIELKEKS